MQFKEVLDAGYSSSDEEASPHRQQSTEKPAEPQVKKQTPESSPVDASRDSLGAPVVSIEQPQALLAAESECTERDTWTVPSEFKSFRASVSRVTALDLPLRGHLLVTGDMQGTIKLFDFHSIDAEGSRCRYLSLETPKPIENLRFSLTGKEIIVIDGERVVHLFDVVQQTHLIDTYKGDPYVKDSARTTGHTHQVYDAQWHPSMTSTFATASLDGTIRIWDSRTKPQGLDQALVNQLVLKAVNSRGSTISQACPVYSIAFLDDKEIIGGVGDGTIQLWDATPSLIKSRKPLKIFSNLFEGISKEAILKVMACYNQGVFHGRSESYLFVFKNKQLVRRVDLKSSDPTRSCLTLANFGRVLITSAEGGRLVVFSSHCLTQIGIIQLPLEQNVKICSIIYNESLKQFFVGLSDGQVICVFDSHESAGGLAIRDLAADGSKAPRPAHKLEGLRTDEISYSWYDLPPNIKQMKDGSVKEVRPRRSQLRATRNPQLTGSGADEPVLKRTMAESVMKDFLRAEFEHRGHGDDDWVEKVRTGHSLGSQLYGNVSIVSDAYRKTQPKPVLDTADQHNPGEALLVGERKCPQCGLKMCTCGYMSILRGRMETDKVLKKARKG
eukprot:Protomagalhaensia_sp_Gyna_25__6104@NODE_986_length_2328_cov_24_567934_g785_i0_p1_GENE_NODE_986_length_2328_cov_24_567934_g785_i0NODE_986_length_2328_cov_24_567934_g785_i0_p1_ORF_typecomplete_len620_score109_60ANAPC4_WD40/PF12894_7/0_51ANAPC4_WD40/PF12894_7/26ANAPC4_WD40/PF12894_7/0_00043ANAPC4_WD40/PF12894_7/5_5ANAPC4_WD40/PF12894_7/7_8e02ANAPC4_WD40/PF12894_7/60WD40/PF00400_32/0_3WD40/PF00400_32/3_5e07WD40/PF00400_32/3_3Ge1_WD40/PF16529_5/1_7Ge1_WD40/PF16529_5/6_5e07WD40_like/PF17005_5/1_4e02WD